MIMRYSGYYRLLAPMTARETRSLAQERSYWLRHYGDRLKGTGLIAARISSADMYP